MTVTSEEIRVWNFQCNICGSKVVNKITCDKPKYWVEIMDNETMIHLCHHECIAKWSEVKVAELKANELK